MVGLAPPGTVCPFPTLASGVAGGWMPRARARGRRVQVVPAGVFSLQAYGPAQHAISTEKIKAKYPDYEVTWANDGY